MSTTAYTHDEVLKSERDALKAYQAAVDVTKDALKAYHKANRATEVYRDAYKAAMNVARDTKLAYRLEAESYTPRYAWVRKAKSNVDNADHDAKHAEKTLGDAYLARYYANRAYYNAEKALGDAKNTYDDAKKAASAARNRKADEKTDVPPSAAKIAPVLTLLDIYGAEDAREEKNDVPLSTAEDLQYQQREYQLEREIREFTLRELHVSRELRRRSSLDPK